MPNGDVTPPECPSAQYHGQAPEAFSGRPVVTTRADETTCRSQASSTQTASADQKLQQRLVVNLPRMRKEELKSISSMGSAQQPRTSTPVEDARPRSAETEPMEVDTPAVLATSQSSSASVATCPKTQGSSASQAQTQLTGPCACLSPKTKQHATDQQRVRDMVAGVLECQGVSREDWEQSQKTDYRVEPLRPPMWVFHRPPGQHLATLEGAPVDEWCAVPDITPDRLFQQLTMLVKGTSQACSYQSHKWYFRHSQLFK